MEKYFGQIPLLKVLDCFLGKKDRNKRMILNTVAEKAGLHAYSASRLIKKLVRDKIVNEERVGKRIKIYWLNQQNIKVPILLLVKDMISAVERDPSLIQKITELL